MWLELAFILLIVIGVMIILNHRVQERYLQLREIGIEENKKIYSLVSDEEEEKQFRKPWMEEDKEDAYQNKYDDGDYDKTHQRRAKGQIRDDGLDH